MSENGTVIDFGEALNRHLQTMDLIPADAVMVETDYVMVARLRVIDQSGTMTTDYRHLWSDRVDECAQEGMAARALRFAQDLNAA